MFKRALYMAPFLCSMSDTSGDGEGDDDAGGGDDKGGGDVKLKDKPGGDERGILDHLDDKGGEEDDDKGGDDKGGEEDDDKPPKLVFKERPDWVAENFWDPKTGEVKVEELAKSQKDLRDKVAKGADKAPKTPEEYKLEIGDDLKEIEARILIDGQEDPLLRWFRATAHEEGVSEATAAAFYSGFMRIAGDLMPAPVDPKTVVKNLGPNGLGVLKNTREFGDNLLKIGVLNADEHNAVMSWFQDDIDVRAFQKMREFYGEKAPPMAATPIEGASSRAELRAKLAELTKKADAGDPTANAEYEKLQQEYNKTYGEEPAGTSLPG